MPSAPAACRRLFFDKGLCQREEIYVDSQCNHRNHRGGYPFRRANLRTQHHPNPQKFQAGPAMDPVNHSHFVFFIGYVFTALRFLNIDLMPGLSLENLVSAIFFFGAVFVLVLAILNRNLLANVFGVGLSDAKALQLFSNHVHIPTRVLNHLLKPQYCVTCDTCHQPVKYSIPDIVRAHPRIERGVIVEKGMGGMHYQFFIRHYCGKEYREIPVRHDSQFEFRSHGPSRLV
jgi:hypothetical protein